MSDMTERLTRIMQQLVDDEGTWPRSPVGVRAFAEAILTVWTDHPTPLDGEQLEHAMYRAGVGWLGQPAGHIETAAERHEAAVALAREYAALASTEEPAPTEPEAER